jgi:hypothetical protein
MRGRMTFQSAASHPMRSTLFGIRERDATARDFVGLLRRIFFGRGSERACRYLSAKVLASAGMIVRFTGALDTPPTVTTTG